MTTLIKIIITAVLALLLSSCNYHMDIKDNAEVTINDLSN